MKDISGQKFGRLTAHWPVGRSPNGKVCWLCACECGGLKVAQANRLRNQSTQSCGCLHKDVTREVRTKRGHTAGGWSPEYRSFISAKQRCLNANHPSYEDYGGRGIEFRFRDFNEFFNELGEKPEPKRQYSLDRINPNGHYEKTNVRWATARSQVMNRRKFAAINKFSTEALVTELIKRGFKCEEYRGTRSSKNGGAI